MSIERIQGIKSEEEEWMRKFIPVEKTSDVPVEDRKTGLHLPFSTTRIIERKDDDGGQVLSVFGSYEGYGRLGPYLGDWDVTSANKIIEYITGWIDRIDGDNFDPKFVHSPSYHEHPVVMKKEEIYGNIPGERDIIDKTIWHNVETRMTGLHLPSGSTRMIESTRKNGLPCIYVFGSYADYSRLGPYLGFLGIEESRVLVKYLKDWISRVKSDNFKQSPVLSFRHYLAPVPRARRPSNKSINTDASMMDRKFDSIVTVIETRIGDTGREELVPGSDDEIFVFKENDGAFEKARSILKKLTGKNENIETWHERKAGMPGSYKDKWKIQVKDDGKVTSFVTICIVNKKVNEH
jgi:hypothetical protein